jgi:ADP-heptose:LPS heptosyltransferase
MPTACRGILTRNRTTSSDFGRISSAISDWTASSTGRRFSTRGGSIGLIPGSENTPEKRWPVGHWRALIEALPAESFTIFGTPNDSPIGDAVAAGFSSARVANRVGQTDLPAFAEHLSRCRALVTNDTGGMHLANALGTPLIALFGPTNPIRTGPIFSGPTKILQPPHSPPTGGGSLADLAPDAVAAALRDALSMGVHQIASQKS